MYVTRASDYALGLVYKELGMAKYRSRIQTGWQFADVNLTREQREEFVAWYAAIADDAILMITEVLLEGYKLTVRYDSENQTWITTLSGQEEMRINARTSLSARHSDIETALCLVVYKHTVICGRGPWEVQSSEDDWG